MQKVIVSQTLSHSVIINRHLEYDIFNQQTDLHISLRHKVTGIKRCHHVPSDNRGPRSICPMSVFIGTGQSDKR